MRCNNCGWDNAPGSSTCVKCGHPLQSSDANYGSSYQPPTIPNQPRGAEPQPRPTVINTQQVAEPVARPTKIVNGASIQPKSPLNETVAQAPQSCPHCNYPVIGNFTSCPNCGASLGNAPTRIQNQSVEPQQQENASPTPKVSPTISHAKEILGLNLDEQVKCDKCGADVPIDFSFCPKCGERIHLPTVRAIRHRVAPVPEPEKPKCCLTIIPEDDEQAEATINEYEGESIILKRENTEPGNRTITSKEQAELMFENGKWFVLNKSEYGSTYIEANRKLEILPGDVLVLGDRRFIFQAEETK